MVIIPQSPEELVAAWLAPLADIIRRLPVDERRRARKALDFHAAAFLARSSTITAQTAGDATDRLAECLAEMMTDREHSRFLAGRDLDGLGEFRALANGLLCDDDAREGGRR